MLVRLGRMIRYLCGKKRNINVFHIENIFYTREKYKYRVILYNKTMIFFSKNVYFRSFVLIKSQSFKFLFNFV